MPSVQSQTPRKRKHEDEPGQFPKRLQVGHTPSRSAMNKTPLKHSMHPWEVDPYHSPSVVRSLFTPSKKTILGPTPQKDGQVLGIFDLLAEDTPSKPTETLVGATPRKPKGLEEELRNKHSRTPASSGKRFMLNAFITPSTNRILNGQGVATPSTVSKLRFDTPSFLRRTQMPVVDENAEYIVSPETIRMPRKPLVRGLSSIVAGLRKIQDEEADQDLAALEEMENEQANGPTPAPKPKVLAKAARAELEPEILKDDRPKLPLGGFDDEAMYDSDPEEVKNPPLGRDGQPLKVYKKKGQKRTTRRVKMKPTRATKPTPCTKPQNPNEDSEDELAASLPEGTIPEAQDQDEVEGEEEGFVDTARNYNSDSQSEYTASEGGTRYRRPDQSKKRKVMGKDGKIKNIARKVGALAHQNFKRLKLRNSGAKGGAAHNSRFRRKK